jgi:hypothetical protein
MPADESSPLEALLARVDVDLDMEAALALARGVSVSAAEAERLSGVSTALLATGHVRRALVLQRLLMSAVERLPPADSARVAATLTYLDVARVSLIDEPDGRLYQHARAAGAAVVDAAPGARLRLAALTIDPYLSGQSVQQLPVAVRRWRERARDAGSELPELAEALADAERLLRESLERDEEVGLAANHLSSLLELRFGLGESVELDEVRGLVRRGLEALDDGDVVAELSLLNRLRSLGEPLPADRVERLAAVPIDEHLLRRGVPGALQVLTGMAQLVDADRALTLLAGARALTAQADERSLTALLRLESELLVAAAPDLPELAGLGSMPAVMDALTARATRAGWDAVSVARTLLQLARVTDLPFDDELDRLRLFDGAREAAPNFCALHAPAVSYLRAAVLVDAAQRAAGAKAWETFVRAHGLAIGDYLDINAPDAARECLTLLSYVIERVPPDDEVILVAITTLAPLVPRFEGVAAVRLLQRIWQRLLERMVAGREQVSAAALLACLQSAKGRRFAAALDRGAGYDAAADADGLALLAEIGEGAEPPTLIDEVGLLRPYEERLAPGAGERDRNENLQRTFDARVQRALSGEAPPLLSLADLAAALPAQTALLDFYLGDTALYCAIVTDAGVALASQLAASAGPSFRAEVDGRHVTFTAVEGRLWELRRGVVAEPGPRPVSRLGGEALAWAADELLGLGDALAQLRAAGKTHLCIVPHGPLHALPFHLLPWGDGWRISVLPNLALAIPAGSGRGRRPRTRALTSVGVGFAGSPEALPDAVEEAREVAALFGTAPLLDAEAMPRTVAEALEGSRLVHIATHGRHNVAAPAFQCLFLHRYARLHAYELLALDLRGLELVTLSACETALGRVDAADDLRGIPASLLLRGAAAVIGTLWRVNSEVSRHFFGELYTRLADGAGRFDAFIDAQGATRAVHPEYRHWGAFHYMGDWR